MSEKEIKIPDAVVKIIQENLDDIVKENTDYILKETKRMVKKVVEDELNGIISIQDTTHPLNTTFQSTLRTFLMEQVAEAVGIAVNSTDLNIQEMVKKKITTELKRLFKDIFLDIKL